MFVQDDGSASGVLQLIHGLQSYPGARGRNRDRVRTFGYEGDVESMGIATITSNDDQLAIAVDGIMSGMMLQEERGTQFEAFEDEPTTSPCSQLWNVARPALH
jgi:hypothetical protein